MELVGRNEHIQWTEELHEFRTRASDAYTTDSVVNALCRLLIKKCELRRVDVGIINTLRLSMSTTQDSYPAQMRNFAERMGGMFRHVRRPGSVLTISHTAPRFFGGVMHVGDHFVCILVDTEAHHVAVYDSMLCSDTHARYAMRNSLNITGNTGFRKHETPAHHDPHLAAEYDMVSNAFAPTLRRVHNVVAQFDLLRDVAVRLDADPTLDPVHVARNILARESSFAGMPKWRVDVHGHASQQRHNDCAVYAFCTLEAFCDAPSPLEQFSPAVHNRDIRSLRQEYAARLVSADRGRNELEASCPLLSPVEWMRHFVQYHMFSANDPAFPVDHPINQHVVSAQQCPHARAACGLDAAELLEYMRYILHMHGLARYVRHINVEVDLSDEFNAFNVTLLDLLCNECTPDAHIPPFYTRHILHFVRGPELSTADSPQFPFVPPTRIPAYALWYMQLDSDTADSCWAQRVAHGTHVSEFILPVAEPAHRLPASPQLDQPPVVLRGMTRALVNDVFAN